MLNSFPNILKFLSKELKTIILNIRKRKFLLGERQVIADVKLILLAKIFYFKKIITIFFFVIPFGFPVEKCLNNCRLSF
jgi:hypothetical protein